MPGPSGHGSAVTSVLWLTTLLAAFSGALGKGAKRTPEFQFTQVIYNATIAENAVTKTYVQPETMMGIWLKNTDMTVRFRIAKGQKGAAYFQTEAEIVGNFCFLLLRTKTDSDVLNRERQEYYIIDIVARGKYRDGSRVQARTKVRIQILDTNDLKPIFYETTYDVTVKEDTPIHASIATVRASDSDIGENGEVYYQFTKAHDTFAIHPVTGVVTLTRHLDHNQHNYYELCVEVHDRGPKLRTYSRKCPASVRIKVIQVNFFNPEIKIRNLETFGEHGIVGTVYGILTVTDKDKGKNGQIEGLEIVPSETSSKFSLRYVPKKNVYHLEVVESLDVASAPDGYTVTVKAVDAGTPSRSSTKTIHISLLDKNDHAPVFAEKVYSVRVNETVPENTPLFFVKADDFDRGRNAEIRYQILSGNHDNWFKLNERTGLLSTNRTLDAETRSTVKLQVKATDQGNVASRRAGNTLIEVVIVDCNDNAPVFNENIKNAVKVEENLQPGTYITTVTAKDADSGDNGFVSYSLANPSSVPFRIDHFTGQIYTTKVLDYESMRREYHVRVRASDWGEPFRRESEAILRIQVANVNDNSPLFEKVNCMGYLSRQAAVGTRVAVMTALDFDVGNEVQYQIIDGNVQDCFLLEPLSGVITVACDLTKVNKKAVSLKIIAFDSVNKAKPTFLNLTLVNNNRNHRLANDDVSVSCQTTNATQLFSNQIKKVHSRKETVDGFHRMSSIYSENRHRPEFDASLPMAIDVAENTPLDTAVLRVAAKDRDHAFNSLLSYVISAGNEDGCFWIDTVTGDLKVKSPLDREHKTNYKLNITVYDHGKPSKSSSKIFRVNVLDANDCPPMFHQTLYKMAVLENVTVGTAVVKVSASDNDLGRNAEVSYFLLSQAAEFAINATSGVLSVAAPLDREAHSRHELQVIAVDNAEVNQLTATATVEIDLIDVNDNAPVFIPNSYHVKIREDHPTNAVVMAVSAQDVDEGKNGEVRYKIKSGDSEGMFNVDRLTGIMRLTKRLDYEERQVYNITVQAHDRGYPSLNTLTLVLVEVVDVNENLYTPQFKRQFASGHVKENSPVGKSVMQVIATDLDVGARDKEIVYSIREGSGLGHFTIDNKGAIYTNEVLDRETTPFYWLTVYAQDRGTAPLSSYIWIYIQVDDVNDNVPQTMEPAYYPSVSENSPMATSVVQVVAEDKDHLSVGMLTYEITRGNPQGFFTIDKKTGWITTGQRKLDRESQAEHELEVMISDNGDPEQTSKCSVVVRVTDENDCAPKFKPSIYPRQVPLSFADTLPSLPLLRVFAWDCDEGQNGDIDYTFDDHATSGAGRFHIHPKTGLITAVKPLKAQVYHLKVRASDLGQPQRNSTVDLRVAMVVTPSQSPHPPKVNQRVQKVIVPEKDPVHSFVSQIDATDEDGDRLWYYIKDGNTGDAFTVATDSGILFVARPLDVETVPFYNITVGVSDGTHEVLLWIHIDISDINDNRPEFTQRVYRAEVTESATEGTSVARVAATDKDVNSLVFYSISQASHSQSLVLFGINERTGVIFTKKSLDRETIQQHQLTVMVRDTGLQHLRNFAHVIINVTDHNDYSPEFLSDIFVGQVYETASIGSSVLSTVAVDRDKGRNAEIHYSIISGNVGGTFTIDKMLGIIRVAKQLDLTSQPEYHLVVKAVDAGSPPKRNTVDVKISVTISNNAPPRFTQQEYSGEVYENRPIGTYIVGVSAVSRSSVVFEIMAGNEKGYFTINPNSGVVATAAVLDYEESHFFNLTIRATNMVNIQSSCTVLLHIMDCNDNRPQFDNTSYAGTITEGLPSGSIVLNGEGFPLVVHATDNDTDLNAILSYSIISSAARTYFSIDTNTGAIRTRLPLDHEAIASYEFSVQVRDKGSPSLSAQVAAMVTINVIDTNDSPPTFSQDTYHATMLLPTYKDVAVIHLKATDPDTGVNTNLTYSIVSGNGFKKFIIEEDTGIIRVVNDHNLAPKYRLHVQVSDGRHESSATVIVHVRNSKDTGLAFTRERYSARVMEEKTVEQTLTMVQVVGHALNEHLAFSILNPSNFFTIGTTSGVLKTTGARFNREERDRYRLVVQVTDLRSPPRTAHVLVDVEVEDRNDNAPVFVNEPYHAILSVNAGKGDMVKKVSAIDQDIGLNGEVRYFILDGDKGKFRIHKRSGQIFVRQAFDEKNSNIYTLKVQAQDRGLTPLKAVTYVTVRVLDQLSPVFKQPYYSFSIPENVPLHHIVSSDLEADSATSSKLIYSITDGDIYDEFAVDFSADMNTFGPCYLKVIDTLDHEMRSQYDLIIRATDAISGAYSEVPVRVEIEDVNDQAPSFERLVYHAEVSEAIMPGSSVLSIKAIDEDSGANKVITYQLEEAQLGSNDSDYFYIDQTTGVIFTRHALDYELRKKHHFVVRAEDSGNPPLSSAAHVHVTISDLNDNPPQFTRAEYDCSVSDIATRGQFVVMVSAFDPDATDALLLMYTIVGGNEKRIFNIDSTKGIISLSNLGRTILHNTYHLNVSVSDGVYTNFAQVNVRVIPSNHYAPAFEQVAYEIEVEESVDVGSVVGQFVAFDNDEGYFGKVNYSITSDQLQKVFHLDATSGELTVVEPLDRERRDEYEIPIMATDNGGDSGFALIRVKVIDVNDNPPEFQQRDYKANVIFSAKPGTVVVKVHARDKDVGNNTAFEYSFSTGTQQAVTSLFALNKDNGEIRVVASLANYTGELFQFFVTAEDRSSLRDNVPIDLYVMGRGDAPPQFAKDHFSFFILENMSPGYTVATLTATTSVVPVTYSIVPGRSPEFNSDGMFGIDEEGNIKIVKELDADTVDMYNFTVRASTVTTPPLVAEAGVVIKTMDINDNAPTFGSNIYVASVNENTAVGTRVIKVSANDNDDGSNADLSYAFAPGSEADARVFTIDQETGWISTISELDRETQAMYTIQILATDRGAKKLTGSCEVHVDILDHNDSPPVFTREVYSGAINEDALPGNIIVTIATTDLDQGSHADVRYYITGGDPLGQFNIQDDGQVFVAKPLDRETKSHYNLEVTATDGAHVGKAQIDIVILDANDNSPVCEEPLYQVLVKESQPEGTFILRVKATDLDEPTTRNVRIAYSIMGDGAEMFTMHRATGIMTTARVLDREEKPEYHLIMRAADGGGQYCEADVYVTLEDINDNVPRFTSHVYNVKVAENSSVNTLLTRVSAIDDDLGLNRKIRYHLLDSMGGQFKMDANSGIISLGKKLDFETHKYYNLTVRASDRGAPQQTSTANVIVRVLDVNDNTPEFERNKYKTRMRENVRPVADIIQVMATSRDSGVNAEITYSIVGGNDHSKFKIDRRTGHIQLISPVDYDQGEREFFLTVQANTPSLSNTTIVEIQVMDSNDNPPVFAKPIYEKIVVLEDAVPGDTVLQLQASDRDSPANSKITYSITDGDDLGQFDIDSDNGYITVAKPLDRETVPNYSLVVTAVDSGMVPQSGSVSVLIEVQDANDNAPWFDQANYSAVVQENLPVELQLLQVKVTDADLGSNGPPFQFDIIGGNDHNEFRIDSSGNLSTVYRFDRRLKDTYSLVVRVYDNGSPPLYNETTITVNVVEESAFPPQVTPLSLSVNAYLKVFPGGVIGRVRATDRDPYDKLTYALVSNNANLFVIDASNGTIKAESLDSGLYTLNVSVTDGRNTVYTDVSLEVHAISEDILNNAVTVRLAKVTPEAFVNELRDEFIRTIHDNFRSRLVHILSVQQARDTSRRKRRSETRDSIDVLVAVVKHNGVLYRSRQLRRRLETALGTASAFDVVKVFHDACTKDFLCGEREVCKTFYELNKDEMINIETDQGNFVSFRYAMVPKCVCRGDKCIGVISEDPCQPNPCPAHEVCRPREDMSYVCTCPDGRTGDKCQLEEPDTNCVDGKCVKEKRPMTFTGDSYVRWRLVQGIERQLRLKMRLRTLQESGVIMYASGLTDYSILEIYDGQIRYRFDCGSGPAYVLISKKVNDGFWHDVEVERQGKHAKVTLDSLYIDQGEALGTKGVVDLSSKDVYFGAEHNGFTPRNQFKGCMRGITLNGELLPYDGANSVALDQTFKNVEFACRDSYMPGVCTSNPCQNHGKCIPEGPTRRRCECPPRFVGTNCEYDRNPCASNPCLNGGQCQNLQNNYKCVCKGRFHGKRCDYGMYCEPNPCLNGGVCEEGSNGALCTCKGFTGNHCEFVIDEDTNYAEIESNGINMRTEEIVGIAGVGVGLIFIVVIFVFVRRWYVRRRRSNMQRHNPSDSDLFRKEDFQRNKLSNLETGASANAYPPPSPRPPPVPTRPASYTPSSNHESLNTLNNFDSVRNYGSAADELDTCQAASIYSPEFLSSFQQELPKNPMASVAPSLPPPPPSNSASDTDSIQKPAWEFDYPNLNENYAQAEPSNKLDKILPKDLQAACNPGSTSSLPVSESEDDMNGYHWDTSDWAPNPALPNITEVPMRESPDSPHSSLHSNESNTHVGEVDPGDIYPDSEYLENDSEYVGDSEYAENEFDDDDDADLDTDFPEPPELMMTSQDDLNFSDMVQHDYSMHPNAYLPTYSYQSSEQLNQSPANGRRRNYSYPVVDGGQGDGPRVPRRFDYNNGLYQTDFEHPGIMSGMDESCMSVGGYTSNASMSDISGLCEIEDSEVNLSDYDDDDETVSNISAKMSNAHLHTQV